MKDSNRANQPCNESSVVIEAHHNLKEKLDIAELILKTLNIKYQIKTFMILKCAFIVGSMMK